MSNEDARQSLLDEIDRARSMLDELGGASRLRGAVSNTQFASLSETIKTAPSVELRNWRCPPVIGFLLQNDIASLRSFESDIDLVMRCTCKEKRNGVARFLSVKASQRVGDFYGGLFEVYAKASAIRADQGVLLDAPLPNGCDSDIQVQLAERKIRVECTVITRSDQTQRVWSEYRQSKSTAPRRRLWRPTLSDGETGQFGPYYDARRIYLKVYDKLAKHFDPDKCQLADHEPNVLLLSFADIFMSPCDPGVGWALDGLLNSDRVPATTGDSESDVELISWIEHNAKRLINEGKLTSDSYDKNLDRIRSAPKMVGAYVLFRKARQVKCVRNTTAREQCAVSHDEMQKIASLFVTKPTYWSSE